MIYNSAPACIGIIMDGNRRWAKAKGLSTFEGHRQGYEKLKDVVKWAHGAGVRHVIVFAFSTENWHRSQEEVAYLMGLFKFVLTSELETFKKEGVRVRSVGQREKLSTELQELLKNAEEITVDCPGPTLHLAISYGGRAEIVSAVNEIISSRVSKISEAEFSNFLWTKDMPDPDLIIRTSGERRLSGFLPWQGVYSELFFTKTLWPDFSEQEFKEILAEFSARERRKGR